MTKDSPGTLLAGKYELLELTGAGGMAVVWRARTLGAGGFNRAVAIKRILPHLCADPELVKMFVEEARVVAELSHPFIAQIHDFGVDDAGQYYIVMEWIDGVDLERFAHGFRTGGGTMPWTLAAAIGIEMLSALGAAHERCAADGSAAPIFHRDVTPQNILLARNGFTKLTDFGIARAMDRATMTLPNAVKGKLSYLAPERLRGHPASAQSDLFGAGVCLWECLAGRRLFEGPTDVEVMFKVAEAKVPDLRAERPDVPLDLWDALHMALAKNALERFGSAELMARVLADLLRTVDEPTGHKRIAEHVRLAQASPVTIPKAGGTEVLDLEDLQEI